MKRTRTFQKGAAAIEFAIILSLLIVITFGIIEFGLLMFNQQVITNASREGARAGIVASSPRFPAMGTPSINSVVQNYCANHLVTFDNPNDPETIVIGYSPNALFRDDLTVQVRYQYSFLLIPNFIPGIAPVLTLQASTVMRYE